MADTHGTGAPRMRQARKSLAHLPSPEVGGDKENATMDSAGMSNLTAHDKRTAKKSRSKSIGPGGLDALKESTDNKRESILPQVKSILKPSVPLCPPKAIPPRNVSKIPSPAKSPGRKTPEKSPRKPSASKSPSKAVSGSEGLPNPFQSPSKVQTRDQSPSRSPTRVAVRTEEEQQAAAKDRERQETLAHKDARRKSLANRRVSFAPEATLHTWNVVELPEDSTTSSASTNSTRRASGLTANAGSLVPSSDASEPPSTPPEQAEELQLAASPAHQRDLHQKKRRRSSGIPPMNFNDPNEFSSSPASGASDDTGTQAFETADEGSDSSDSDGKDMIEEETVTNIDGDDNTLQSTGENSIGSSGRLEAALQQASHQAGTQGIDYDEHGDITMEMADEETTAAFKPWMEKGKQAVSIAGDPSALLDQENINPFSPAFKANMRDNGKEEAGDTMNMTEAVGGILPAAEGTQISPKRRPRKSITGKRRSSVARRRYSGDGSNLGGDETMDLTTAIGGIQQEQREHNGDSANEDDEELTMEFTSVVGGVVQPNGKSAETYQDANRRKSGGSSNGDEEMDMTMDMTFAAGGILLPSITERTEPSEDQTMEMDITTAVGAILPEQLSTADKAKAKALMELEADAGQLSASPYHHGPSQKPMGAGVTDERPLPAHTYQATTASETVSPSLAALQTRGSARKGAAARQSTTPKSRHPTPIKKPSTPSKQLTPQPTHPTIPEKTPPSKNVTMRTSSPKKLFKTEIRNEKKRGEDATPDRPLNNALFRKDATTGATTPSIVLKPHRRRSSGLGIDREGLGSPRVTALLDRRGSIGDDAKAFVAQSKIAGGVRFEDPRVMEQEVEHEREEDQRRESGRGIMEKEADSQDLGEEKDVTANLKDMIESLTPQKNKLRGRKSLHVGAAKGLLGKRPAELDEDDNEDATPKRLRSREGSPVKKAKLPAPPSQAATTGRVTRSTRLSLAEAAGNARPSTPSGNLSPSKGNTTPKDQPRFKDAENQSPSNIRSFEEKLEGTDGVAELADEEDRIQLQDFLNMTSIRFMELTTTKRRHTIAPTAMLEQSAKKENPNASGAEEDDAANELESCVVAGSCTVPMLELYQHSCRELKSYISEGRKVAKEIEVATYEDNPPLFREYMAAPPDVKPIMDNQFKNVKTNARLLSKAMWYEWRMKLLAGLKEGLVTVGEGMEEDDRSLTQQEQLLNPVLPGLVEEHDKLESQVHIAQAQANELADCDQDELKDARDSLVVIQSDLEAKQNLVSELQDRLREREDSLEDVLTRKQECVEEIKEAEKVRQDCRGWSVAEVAVLQDKVTGLESAHGWTITSTAGPAISMNYARTLSLLFTPSAFLPNDSGMKTTSDTESTPISLTYIADAHERHPEPLTTEKRFFIQIMRAQLQCLQQSSTKVKDLLAFVSESWKVACSIAEEARKLGVRYIAEPTITADEVMAVRAIILLRAMRTKVEVCFEVRVRSGEGGAGLGVGVKSSARVVYGEGLNEQKMGEFLESRIGAGGWGKAVGELEERLMARGRK